MKENVVHEQMEFLMKWNFQHSKEVGVPLQCPNLSALASMTNLTILPSVPYICVDMGPLFGSVPAIEFGWSATGSSIETEICASVVIRGYFILMPEQ